MNMKSNIQHLSVFVAFLASICIVSCIDNIDVDWSEEKIVEISPEVVPVNIFGDPGTIESNRFMKPNQIAINPMSVHKSDNDRKFLK